MVDLCISLYQNLDELKQKLGLLPQIATEVDIGDYSYYEINDVDILNGTRKKRVTILIEMMKKEKKKIFCSQFFLSFLGSCCEYFKRFYPQIYKQVRSNTESYTYPVEYYINYPGIVVAAPHSYFYEDSKLLAPFIYFQPQITQKGNKCNTTLGKLRVYCPNIHTVPHQLDAFSMYQGLHCQSFSALGNVLDYDLFGSKIQTLPLNFLNVTNTNIFCR